MDNNDDFVRCPICGNVMVLRERKKDGKPFFGCQLYPKCNGNRDYSEGKGKSYISSDYGSGNDGRCLRCGQYPSYGPLSPMGLCPGCQEEFDEE
jgi:ssDNA-binding Zn-finger/Zn-ribbon topoisomerase 1